MTKKLNTSLKRDNRLLVVPAILQPALLSAGCCLVFAAGPSQVKTNSNSSLGSQKKLLFVIPYKDPKLIIQALKNLQFQKNVPPEVPFYYEQRLLIFSKRLDEAKKNIADKLKTNPNWSLLYFLQSDIAELEFREEDQILLLKKALAAEPECVGAAFKLSDYYKETGKPEESVKILKNTLARLPGNLSPERIETLKNLSKVQLNLKDYAGAEASLKEAIQLYPIDSFNHSLLIGVYIESARWKDVKATADQVLKSKNIEPSFYYFRALANFNLGGLKEAERDLDTFISGCSTPQHDLQNLPAHSVLKKARELRAEIYEKTGRKNQAAKDRNYLKGLQKEAFDNCIFRESSKKKQLDH